MQQKNVQNILYLGWLGNGNVGDDLLFELFKNMFLKYHRSHKENTAINIDMFPPVPGYRADVSRYDLVVLGGGSLIDSSFWLLTVCNEALENDIPVVSWGSGADGIPRHATVDSIRLPNDEAEHFKEVYEKIEYLSVRGPYSKKLVLNTGLDNKVNEIGDPALIYVTETFGNRLDTENSSRTILINWGTSYNNIYGRNESRVEQEMTAAIQSLIATGYEVVCYPIWTEDIRPVERLVEKVNDNRFHAITEVYEPQLLQRLISGSYLTINFKLHANIMSASADIPFICLAYRGKCFDFAETVDCAEFALPTDEVTAEGLLEAVATIEADYDGVVERFQTAKEKYYPKVLDSIYKISDILNVRTGSGN